MTLTPTEQAAALPIYERAEAIVQAITDHRVVVVEGPTGSGKTTQIPRMLTRALDVKRIGVTQPRRIAAVSVAWRIAAEEGTSLGDRVGYSIRFDNRTSPATVIKLMTDGILLMEARADPDLVAYDILIIDEAHERSLNIDVILGLVYQLLQRRDDLRVVISSATLNPELFQEYFAPVVGPVPRISIPGRTHPVAIQYRPLRSSRIADIPEVVAEEVVYLHRYHDPGAILAFLSGAPEIRRTATAVAQRWHRSDLEVLPLYARLTREEQERVFDDCGRRRKVVLATNIAETSITIPDVRYVIDTGLAKVPYFAPRTHLQTLREQPISRGSAEQRAGRAGRTGPGLVIRLYTEASLREREALSTPEITRLDLSEVVLRLIDLGVRDIEGFPFPTAPETKKIRAAINTLEALGAIDADRHLTAIGQRIAPFPLSPDLARMVVEAAERFPRVVDEVLIVGAFLSGQRPFVLPPEDIDRARAAHRRFHHPLGDAVAQVKLYRAWQKAADKERFCAEHFLDPEVMAFAERAHTQLAEIAIEQQIEVNGGGQPDEIVQAVAAGLADRVLIRGEGGYRTLTGVRVGLHPGSLLAGPRPRLAVAAELVAHARTYAINVSALKREWLARINPQAARHLGIRAPPKTPRPVGPTQVTLGPFRLSVTRGRGKPFIELDLTQLAALRSIRASDLDPATRKIRAQVRWTDQLCFAAVPLRLLLASIRLGVYPPAGVEPPRGVVFNVLWEIDRGRHSIERALEAILAPAAQKRAAGWVALVANGGGGYWLDVLPFYKDALQTSRLSVETLSDELAPGDELQQRAQDLSNALVEAETTLSRMRAE